MIYGVYHQFEPQKKKQERRSQTEWDGEKKEKKNFFLV
jgi:hypothetical protein